MKTFENSKNTESFNGIISRINNVDAKKFILKHKKLFSVVTEPFMYHNIEMDIKTLSEKKCYKDIHGTYYILGFKKVWQLDEVPEVKEYGYNGITLIQKQVTKPANCINCYFREVAICPVMPIFKGNIPSCNVNFNNTIIYVEKNRAPEQDKNCS